MRRDSKNASTSPRRQEMRDVSTSPKFNEHQLREDLTKSYAREVKAIESEFKSRLETFKEALHESERRLHVRTQEVESLKTLILKERSRVSELLAEKEAEAHETLLNCRQQVLQYKERIEMLQAQCDEKNAAVEQLKRQATRSEERQEALTEEVHRLKYESVKSTEHLSEKLRSAKQTINNYKQYIEEKEQHLIREYDRLKSGFKEASEKIERKTKEVLEKNERKFQQKLDDLERQYSRKNV